MSEQINSQLRGRKRASTVGRATGLFAAAFAAAAGVAALTVTAGQAIVSVTGNACPGHPVMAIAAPQVAVEEVGLDVSASAASKTLHALYEQAALAVVDRAAEEKAALRVVAFGASGAGATPVFQGSFAPKTSEEVYNLAEENRLRCWAHKAIRRALAAPPSGGRGSDVSGAAAALIRHARSLSVGGAQATVTVITDGCQAPARTGPNSTLTDLCGKLAAGRTPTEIVRARPAEFRLPNARGVVTVVMKGVGVGRWSERTNSVRVMQLVRFWRSTCVKAHARACVVGSDLP